MLGLTDLGIAPGAYPAISPDAAVHGANIKVDEGAPWLPPPPGSASRMWRTATGPSPLPYCCPSSALHILRTPADSPSTY